MVSVAVSRNDAVETIRRNGEVAGWGWRYQRTVPRA